MLNEHTEKFLKKYFNTDYKIKKLAGDASDRIYYRIITAAKTYVLCNDSDFKKNNEENYPFLKIQKLFSASGIKVPEIYAVDSESGSILQSDHGDDLLYNVIEKSSNSEKIKLYKTAINELLKIQSINGEKTEIPFSISFDVEKLMYEFNFFVENTLKIHLGFNSDLELRKLNECFFDISRILYQPSLFVLCHRDYHSRNILINELNPAIIDFQDARMGLPQYDLASLLRDSYISLTEVEHEELFNYYFKLSSEKKIHNMQMDMFEYYYDLISFQRNIKAAGSFGYLTHVKKLDYYDNFIESTLRRAYVYSIKRPELSAAIEIIMKGTETN